MASARDMYVLSRAMLAGRIGVLAVLKMYLDESGTHDNSPVVAVAGYFARPTVWREWIKDWNRTKKPVKVYHSVDCNAREGEFKGWTRERRNEFVISLLPLIPKHELRGIAAAINLDDFREAAKSSAIAKAWLPTPYVPCFQWVMMAMITQVEEAGRRERVAFIHEANDYTDQATKAFEWVQENFNERQTAMSLTFGGKSDYVPLQAADILAYEVNHRIRDVEGHVRPSWRVLSPPGNRVRVHYFDRTNMSDLMKVGMLYESWDKF